MGRILGLLAVALIAVLAYKLYFSKLQTGGTPTPSQAVNETGVKSDLLSIAQAERVYSAQHGAYASLNELESSGALSFPRKREGYRYEIEKSDSGFRVIARCGPSQDRPCVSYSIDESMEVRSLP